MIAATTTTTKASSSYKNRKTQPQSGSDNKIEENESEWNENELNGYIKIYK